MPKRHRVTGKTYHDQGITIPVSTQMVPSYSIVNSNLGPANGISDANTAMCPLQSIPSDGCVPANTFAEVPTSASVGRYTFNFSRMWSQLLGAPAGASPFLFLGSFFRRLRFGTGYMTIERVDTGAATRYCSEAAVAGTVIPYTAPKPLPLDIYYLRMNPHEKSWQECALFPVVLRADPRTRRVRLYPGQKVTFKFSPLKFCPPDYIINSIRTYVAANQEVDLFRRVEIPGRSRRLGWVPTQLVTRANPLQPAAPTVNNGGLGPDVVPIVSTSLIFHFDVPQVGLFTVPPVSTPDQGVVTDATAVNLCAGMLIRRREFTTVHLAGFVPPMQYNNADQYNGSSFVGAVLPTYFWGSGGATAGGNQLECFDPPRITDLRSSASTIYPLYQPGTVANATSAVIVPWDTEQAVINNDEVLPVPPATQLP